MQNDFNATDASNDSRADRRVFADRRDDQGPERERAASQVGIDTQELGRAVGDRAGEWQQMLIEEIEARPLRAIGWAAAAGFVFGVWSAR